MAAIRRYRRAARAGFTIAELLISMVIVAVIGAALTRLVVAQSRFYNSQTLQRSARDVSRSALNILQADLRMVEETNGVTVATANDVTLRVPFAVGVACTATLVHTMPADSSVITAAVASTNGVGVGVRDMTTGNYTLSSYAAGALVTVDTAPGRSVCVTLGTVTPVWGGKYYQVPSPLTGFTWAGQPVLMYRTIRYRIASSALVTGRKGLFRTAGGTEEELVAPLDDAASFAYYIGNSKTPIATPAAAQLPSIYGIRFNLTGSSERTDPATGNKQTAALVTSVFFKNRRL